MIVSKFLQNLIIIISFSLILGLSYCLYMLLFKPKKWKRYVKRKLIRQAINRIRKYKMTVLVRRYLQIHP